MCYTFLESVESEEPGKMRLSHIPSMSYITAMSNVPCTCHHDMNVVSTLYSYICTLEYINDADLTSYVNN